MWFSKFSKSCSYYISYNAANSITSFHPTCLINHIICNVVCNASFLLQCLVFKASLSQGFLRLYKAPVFTSWVAPYMTSTVNCITYSHHRILTHHECGCKTCRWVHRVQSPPGWRAWLSEQPPGVGTDHPPSWKTTTLICVCTKPGHTANWARRFIYSACWAHVFQYDTWIQQAIINVINLLSAR